MGERRQEVVLSADGLRLAVITKTPDGVRTVEYRRNRKVGPFTPQDVESIRAESHAPLTPGERRVSRRFRLPFGWALYLGLSIGPPTWRYPQWHVQEGAVIVGWLRTAVAAHVRRSTW